MLIDVREADEFANGHAQGAIHLSKGVIELRIEETVPDVATPIICYCGGGSRSALAADNLQKMGYTNVASMAGGFKAMEKCRAADRIMRSTAYHDRQHVGSPSSRRFGFCACCLAVSSLPASRSRKLSDSAVETAAADSVRPRRVHAMGALAVSADRRARATCGARSTAAAATKTPTRPISFGRSTTRTMLRSMNSAPAFCGSCATTIGTAARGSIWSTARRRSSQETSTRRSAPSGEEFGLRAEVALSRGAQLHVVADEGRRSCRGRRCRSRSDLRIAYGHAHYGTGYFILWKVLPGIEHLVATARKLGSE